MSENSHIPNETLQSRRGVDAQLEAVDAVPNKLQDRMKVFEELRLLRRKEEESVADFIQEYMIKYQNLRNLSESFTYDDTVLSLDLLNACNLSKEEENLVLAQMVVPPCPNDVIDILTKNFCK